MTGVLGLRVPSGYNVCMTGVLGLRVPSGYNVACMTGVLGLRVPSGYNVACMSIVNKNHKNHHTGLLRERYDIYRVISLRGQSDKGTPELLTRWSRTKYVCVVSSVLRYTPYSPVSYVFS